LFTLLYYLLEIAYEFKTGLTNNNNSDVAKGCQRKQAQFDASCNMIEPFIGITDLPVNPKLRVS
jgi:hypothetical protein